MKTLILKSNKDEFERFFIDNMQLFDCVTTSYYKKITLFNFGRILAVLWMQKIKLPFQNLWYGSWKKRIQEFDQVIIFDRVWNDNIVEYIHKKKPDCRIIFWYWNSLVSQKVLDDKYRSYCECWSFDKEDVRKYKMQYNHMFYFPQEKTEYSCCLDAFFVGADKGRVTALMEIAEVFKQYKLKSNLIIIGALQKELTDIITFRKKNLGYLEYLELLKNCKCIIDIVQEGQEGVTIRVIEALMYEKKLITTNKNIYEYEFYCKDNIFVWGDRPSCELKDFIITPYKKIEGRIKEKYSFENWLKNFNKEII